MPRWRAPRGAESLPTPDAPVAFRYFPPILATLAASLCLTLLFGFFTMLTLQTTLALVTPDPAGSEPSILASAACGLLTLALLAGAGYFVYSTIVAARDLVAQPVYFDGTVHLKHNGRGRGGGNWVVIGPPQSAPDPARPVAPSLAPTAGSEPLVREPAERGFVSGKGESFGAQLQGVQVESRADDAELVLPDLPGSGAWRRLVPGEVNLRVDKHMFEALMTGDDIQAVYSPHLQHVYYMRKRMEGSTVVLRNTILI